MAKSKRLHSSKTNPRTNSKPKQHSHPYAIPSSTPQKPNSNSKSKSKPKPSSTDNTTTTSAISTPPPLPFTPHTSILLFGEADFSYTLSLLTHHACADLTATCLESAPEVLAKHAHAAANIAAIATTGGARILYAIDVHHLTKGATRNRLTRGEHEILLPDGTVEKGSGYDLIVFNFPHTGGLSTDVNRQVRSNQALLAAFFAGVKGLLHSTRGTVLVSLFEGLPYSLWNVRDLARSAGLRVLGSWAFEWGFYGGYGHCRTAGDIGEKEVEENGEMRKGEDGVDGEGEKEKRKAHPDAWVGNDRPARTYAFGRQEWVGTGEEGLMKLLGGSVILHGQGKKRKKGKGGAESDDED